MSKGPTQKKMFKLVTYTGIYKNLLTVLGDNTKLIFYYRLGQVRLD